MLGIEQVSGPIREELVAQWDGRHVAVTGATGFLGSHLVSLLVGAGADVTVLVRDSVPRTDISAGWWDRVAIVQGACEDQQTVERMLVEYEVKTFFHLAAQSQVGVANENPPSTYSANVAGTWSVLEAARRSPRVEQVLVASSDKAYGSQPALPYTEEMPLLAVHPYDVSKACADLIAQSYHESFGLPVVITRCGNLFGPGDVNWERLIPSTCRSLYHNRAPVLRSDGTMIRDYLYVVDGALAYLHTAARMRSDPSLAGQAFNFSMELPLSVIDVVTAVQKVAGIGLEPEILGAPSGEIQAQYLSSEKARRVLDWTPAFSFEDALNASWEWYSGALSHG